MREAPRLLSAGNFSLKKNKYILKNTLSFCPRIWWGNNIKRLVNQCSNEKPIDLASCSFLHPFSGCSSDTVFGVELIIWDAFSAKEPSTWGIVDSTPLLIHDKQVRSEKNTAPFFLLMPRRGQCYRTPAAKPHGSQDGLKMKNSTGKEELLAGKSIVEMQ